MPRKKTTKKAAAALRHRPKVVRTADDVGAVYRMTCTCGTTGRDWYARPPAKEELERHIATLPRVPAGQECRDPKRHDRRHWEPCGLCAGQEALFDLADLGVAG
ncbi:hypothetical protein [Planomonospora parontospora]|uniref:hypothetical protein n=1 Tax=Planomonospora parontospora TaxID=58119 RepID=UPI001671384E|nr:hypothetical protein [Planomonospora parontospora]GGL56571.1 hypothetical protein GCM10014719_67500 [Planomonospora parontospora subsp. antibiotica]GII19940.1 hypothetical protein Ppa05_66660 [Planomonospora parontospora subsp. antibiotica]